MTLRRGIFLDGSITGLGYPTGPLSGETSSVHPGKTTRLGAWAGATGMGEAS